MIFEGAPVVGIAAFLAVLALSLLAVWLRPLARRVTVAFGELWAKALAKTRAGIPWREAFGALLFGGALAAIAAAIAAPVISNRPPRRIAIVIDASASMNAASDGRRAIDHARVTAAKIAKSAGDDDALALFRASSETRAIGAMELASLDTDDGALDEKAALAAAAAFLAAGEGEKHLFFLTDREIEGASAIAFGSGRENLAVEALGAAPGGPASGGVELLVTIANHGRSAATADVVLHTAEFRLGGARVQVAPGERETRAFHLKGMPSREVLATLDSVAFASGEPDALPHDDRRAAWAADRGLVDVVLVGKDRFLEGALAVLGGVRTRVVAANAPVGAADVVIVHGDRQVSDANVLRLGTKRGTEVKVPALVDWNGEHPATKRVSLDDLTIESAHLVEPGSRGVVLAAAEKGALAVAREHDDGSREIVLGFDPSASDFPLRLGYPVFVGSAVRWLAGAEGGEAPLAGFAGEPLALDLGPTAAIARAVPLADTRQARATITPRGELVALDAGLYEVRSPTGTRFVEISAAPSESIPSDARLGSLPAWVGSEEPERSRALSPLLFALGALLLTWKALLG